jgi:catechol 2,3-dioxygenase-like lactoylglutathione lyase family enzyme
MIGYTTVGTNQRAQAVAFYDELFKEVGVHRLIDFGARGMAWGVSWDKPSFAVLTPFDGQSATVGNGSMVALTFGTRESVNALHAKAVALGGRDEGAPGLREGNFYAAYFRDLDGNKLCVFTIIEG